MDTHTHKIAQIYGYAVCLIAVITFLIAVTTVIEALFDLNNPQHAGFYRGPNIASFEAYRLDQHRSPKPVHAPADPVDVADDETLRAVYETAKVDDMERVKYQAWRQLTTHGLLLIVCITLFVGHFVWVRNRVRSDA